MYTIEINNQQSRLEIDSQRLRAAVSAVLQAQGITAATISIAIADNAQMHELNRSYLQHDYPTDVLSFVLEQSGTELEGEIVASADHAADQSQRYCWPAADELL